MAANTPPRVYVSALATEMSTVLRNNDRMSLAYMISDYEAKYSPSVHLSRILKESYYHISAIMMLSQVQEDILLSIFNNSLIENVKTRSVKLHPWNIVEKSTFLINANPPKIGIYINYLTDRNGGGLTVPEYEKYAEAMLAVIDDRRMPSEPLRDLVAECDQFFLRYTGKTYSEIPKMQDSCSKHRVTFNIRQRDLIAEAKAQGATEIRLPGEAGYSENCDKRIAEHDRLEGSANFFRLARCVLGCLFPGRFRLYSVILFRATQLKDADIGESMASHIGATYAAYGGFNFVQAGVQILTAHRLHQDDFRKAAKALPTMITFMKDNLEESLKYWRKMNDDKRDRLNTINHHLWCQQLDEEMQKKIEAAQRLEFKKDLEACKRRIKRIEKITEYKDNEVETALRKIKGLAKSLGILKPVYQETQAGGSVWDTSQFASQG